MKVRERLGVKETEARETTEENNIERRKRGEKMSMKTHRHAWTSILSNHKVTSDTRDNTQTMLQAKGLCIQEILRLKKDRIERKRERERDLL